MNHAFHEYAAISHVINLLLVPSQVKPITRSLISKLVCSLPVGIDELDAFGCPDRAQYQALQAVIHSGVLNVNLVEVAKELDTAAYKGQALTAVVAKYAPAYQGLRFQPLDDALGDVEQEDGYDESIPF